MSGLDCPDWFGKIWVGSVSLNSWRQIYAFVFDMQGSYMYTKMTVVLSSDILPMAGFGLVVVEENI